MPPQIAEYGATSARRRTLWFTAANLLVFLFLLSAMFYVRSGAAIWPSPFQFGSLLMVFAMAAGGLCGSVTIVVAARSAAQGKIEEAVRWVAIAIVSWVVFLFLEAVEWANLFYLVDIGPRTKFGATYLALTGSHWVCVIVCVIWFTLVVSDVRRRDALAAAIYSHFLAVWWLVLVAAIYLPNSNPLEGF